MKLILDEGIDLKKEEIIYKDYHIISDDDVYKIYDRNNDFITSVSTLDSAKEVVDRDIRTFESLKKKSSCGLSRKFSKKSLDESLEDVVIPEKLSEIELEYEDLDVDIDYNYDDESKITGGTITDWTYWVEPNDADFCEYLNKTAEEITQEDIDNIDEYDFTTFLMTKYEAEAIEDARENYEYDDVHWNDGSDDYDYDESDRVDYDESLKETKKDKDEVVNDTSIDAVKDDFNPMNVTELKNEVETEKDKTEEDADDTTEIVNVTVTLCPSLVNTMLSDEFNSIENINSLISTIDTEKLEDADAVKEVLNAIVDEKNILVGMLTKLSEFLSEDDGTEKMQQGQDKAEDILDDASVEEKDTDEKDEE